MPVIVLRHTRPRLGASDLCYGRTDLDLAEGFEAAAAAIAAALPPVAAVVTSPLTRCRRLAEALAADRALPLAVDPRLAEMDFGAWEARPWSEIPRDELDAWAADFHGARPHGGESVAALAARVGAAVAEAPRRRPPVLWVAHAGVVKAVAATLGVADGWQTRVDFGAWVDFSAARAP